DLRVMHNWLKAPAAERSACGYCSTPTSRAELTPTENWHRGLSYVGLVLIPARSATTSGRQSKASGKNSVRWWRCADNPPRPSQLPPFQEAQRNDYLYPIHARSASPWRTQAPTRARLATRNAADAQRCTRPGGNATPCSIANVPSRPGSIGLARI